MSRGNGLSGSAAETGPAPVKQLLPLPHDGEPATTSPEGPRIGEHPLWESRPNTRISNAATVRDAESGEVKGAAYVVSDLGSANTTYTIRAGGEEKSYSNAKTFGEYVTSKKLGLELRFPDQQFGPNMFVHAALSFDGSSNRRLFSELINIAQPGQPERLVETTAAYPISDGDDKFKGFLHDTPAGYALKTFDGHTKLYDKKDALNAITADFDQNKWGLKGGTLSSSIYGVVPPELKPLEKVGERDGQLIVPNTKTADLSMLQYFKPSGELIQTVSAEGVTNRLDRAEVGHAVG